LTAWVELKGPSRRRTALFLVIGTAISAVLLWVALRKVSYDEMADAFSGAEWGWLPAALAALLVSLVIRTERWRLFFEDPRKLSAKLSFASLNIGVLFNILLPQRAGELTRIVAVHRGARLSRVETGGTIVAERLTDVFVLGTLGLAFWPFFPSSSWITVVEIVCIGAVAGPILAVILLSRFRGHLPRIAQRFLSRVPYVGVERSEEFTRSFAAGTRVLLRPRRLLPILSLGFLAWGTMGLANWFTLQMFDFDLDAVPAMVLVLVAVNFAVAIPVGPGSVGVFEAATQASLTAFGLNASDALSYAVIAHALVVFPFIVLGGLGIVTVGRMSRERSAKDSLVLVEAR
jgi:uncharacterized protein (TIRG00374 family)